MHQAVVGSGLRQRVEVCGEAVGAAGSEGDESGFVDVAAAVVVGDAVTDGACVMAWPSLYQTQKERSGVQGLSVAVIGDFVIDDGKDAAPVAVVWDIHCYLHFFHCQ